jgi:putative flippase GtrA
MRDWSHGGEPALHAEAKRFVSFLVVGGSSTILNLAVVTLISILLRWAYIPTALVAYEAGILYSFILMDTLTFRALSDAAGGWVARCLRFHGAYVVGVGLTLVLAEGFQVYLRWQEVVAHAVALAIATVVNFTSIRFWAYRGRRQAARPLGTPLPARIHAPHRGPAEWAGPTAPHGAGPPPAPSPRGPGASPPAGQTWGEPTAASR